MQVCTSLQTDNHASTPPLSFFTGRMPFLPPNQQRQSTEGIMQRQTLLLEICKSCLHPLPSTRVLSPCPTHPHTFCTDIQGCRGDGTCIPIPTPYNNNMHCTAAAAAVGMDPHTHGRVQGCRGDEISIPIPT